MERDVQGDMFQRLIIKVRNADAGEVHQVMVNGDTVGEITIGENGRGRLELRTAEFIEDGDNAEPLPDAFPTLDTGDQITVGPLSGYFFDQHDQDAQRVRLRGDFGDATGPSGNVRYREFLKPGRGFERRFQVEIEDAAEGEEFDIMVNGDLVGTLLADGSGQDEFELRTKKFIDNPNDGDPIPGSFPSLIEGDVVTVGPFAVTMEVVGTGGGGGGQ